MKVEVIFHRKAEENVSDVKENFFFDDKICNYSPIQIQIQIGKHNDTHFLLLRLPQTTNI